MDKSVRLSPGQAVPNGYIAAPSPSGTNFEGLYVPRSWVQPAANDAMPKNLRRPARDQELDNMLDNLDPETAYAVACMLLDKFPDLKERLDRNDTRAENNGNDRGFTPHLKPGGAQDGALPKSSRLSSSLDSLGRAFPESRRVKLYGY